MHTNRLTCSLPFRLSVLDIPADHPGHALLGTAAPRRSVYPAAALPRLSPSSLASKDATCLSDPDETLAGLVWAGCGLRIRVVSGELPSRVAPPMDVANDSEVRLALLNGDAAGPLLAPRPPPPLRSRAKPRAPAGRCQDLMRLLRFLAAAGGPPALHLGLGANLNPKCKKLAVPWILRFGCESTSGHTSPKKDQVIIFLADSQIIRKIPAAWKFPGSGGLP